MRLLMLMVCSLGRWRRLECVVQRKGTAVRGGSFAGASLDWWLWGLSWGNEHDVRLFAFALTVRDGCRLAKVQQQLQAFRTLLVRM